MAKLILIEDDLILAHVVKSSLEADKHHVDHTASGDEGFAWLKGEHYDAAIVDWQLPGMNGPDICREFRKGGGSSPILMITGKDKTKDLVEGLESGADDFISKPFALEEMHARLRSLLRRHPVFEDTVLRVGDIEIDTGGGTVKVAGQSVSLPRKELAILELLMRHPGHVFSGNAIMERVWPSDSDSSPEIIRCHITRLRSRLGDASKTASESLKSVYGLGYKIDA
ncbi:MAG: response regulator transcription factor [Candidatus Obscuribacterales bacterium]|nr:response regulator transcription factor [Candidatus Obscuribacterales bacterium]